MNYKAIMLDLDDTTVLNGKENLPSPRVTQAIARAKEKIHVCIATARTLEDAMIVINHLSLSGPCILGNGTQIYDPQKRRVIHEILLPKKVITPVFEICKKLRVVPMVYNGEQDIAVRHNLRQKVLGIYIPQVEPERADSVVEALKVVPGVTVQKLVAWEDRHYMSVVVMDEKGSKLHAILEVARLLHIKTEEIIGVGDSYNDFPLLLACGLKIAMANAVPELKGIADFIAPSVYEDGVATVIEKFVLAA